MTTEQPCTIDSERSYLEAIDATLAVARNEIRIFDRNLARMAFGRPARAGRLREFLTGAPDRRLLIVVHEIDALEREMPGIVDLIRLYGHLIETRITPDHLRHLADCWVLADQMHGAIRFHADHARGKWVTAVPAEIAPWWRRAEDLWLESQPCFPGAATGL